ncbi:MAG: fumarylacetoacetate hydrolase family protein [Proteobacteria bacterium]|nr:fumarylacetoacetate hydrolase family protein [Pseudomonadota bacterium]
MKLYNTPNGLVLERDGAFDSLGSLSLDRLLTSEAALDLIEASRSGATAQPTQLLAPVGSQEVWAAGVTYYRSRTARMQESANSGGADFYDNVYSAERPELFFKANPHHVVGPGAAVRIRKDSKWNVPEPELTLCVSKAGTILGYTVGNDVSSRDLEGENPLYLPQAKTYDQACALGPCILLGEQSVGPDTQISIRIVRAGTIVFEGKTALEQMKRAPRELVAFLTRENSFPYGAFLMTGTGIVPSNDFSLASGDEVSITIDAIGTLTNPVA